MLRLGIVTPSLNVSQIFTYDAFNRLLTSKEGLSWSQTNCYDQSGNRGASTTPSGVFNDDWTPNCNPGQFSAKNQWVRGSGDVYDAAGNQMQIASNSSPGVASSNFTYDGENRLSTSTVGGTGLVTYLYDAQGRRVMKLTGTASSYASKTVYVYDAMGMLAEEISTDPGPTVTSPEYLTADHLGSTRLVTDSSGNAVRRYDFLPFGEEIPAGMGGRVAGDGYGGDVYPAAKDVTSRKFTGKERDVETGLDYFGARYLSSAQGRWTSPDVINLTDRRVLSPSNTLNKYIYGGNNPLKYLDPDGRDITLVYTDNGPAGHFWMVAADPAGKQTALLDFGPQHQTPMWERGIPFHDVPGTTNYGFEGAPVDMSSADAIRQNYTSLTIQLNPEETQAAITAIQAKNAELNRGGVWDVTGPNCTTVCRDIVNKILRWNSSDIVPSSLWRDAFLKWSRKATAPPPPSCSSMGVGCGGPQPEWRHGVDYGNPRYGINTFDLLWLVVQQEKKKPVSEIKSRCVDCAK